MTGNITYVGRDLEAMSYAGNYHKWILNIFAPYLGNHLVEVGAGAGSFSELLAGLEVQSLSLVEPSREMYQLLKQRVVQFPSSIKVNTYNALFENVFDQ